MQQNCKQCQDQLWSYLAKELPDAETKIMEEHLQSCPSCRKEAELLSEVVFTLQEELPIPATFSSELHEKLTLAAEEMAAQPQSPGKRILETLKNLPRHRGFRTLAPALVCLVLVVGIFSSGLYETWNSADQLLSDPPPKPPVREIPSSSADTSTKTSKPEPSSSTEEPAPVKEKQTASHQSRSSASSEVTTKPAPRVTGTPTESQSVHHTTSTPTVPVPEHSEPITPPSVESQKPAPADIADIPAPAMEADVPAPAAVDPEEVPAGYAIPRHLPRVSCLTVSDTETFLDGWQESSDYEWESHVQDIPANEILPGVNPDAVVLELTSDATESLVEYASTAEEAPEDQGETLVVITEDEE